MASIPEEVTATLAENGLCILGGFSPLGEDAILGRECQTLIMIGPDETRFWSIFSSSAEYSDGAVDPLDRWSHRVLTQIATDYGLAAHFPFGGPPFAPFYQWALRTGRAFASPIQLLVHDTSGLFVSFRGALSLPYAIEFDMASSVSPCATCAAPCLSACPVSAFETGDYNTVACSSEIRTYDRQNCLTKGCAARRACPLTNKLGRIDAQSQFHMHSFMKGI